MHITTLFNQDRTRAHVQGLSKKQVLETLAKVFAESNSQLDDDDVYQHLVNREKLGTTGLGDGVAIPHCRFNTRGETYCACITLERSVDFDAVDGKPVDLIFAMLVPEDAEKEHLQLLGDLAEMLQRPSYAAKLRAASSDDELFTVASSSA